MIYIYWLYYIPICVLYCIITVIPLPINITNCTPKCLKPQHQRGRQCEHHSAEKRLGLQCWGALCKSDSHKLSASDWGWLGDLWNDSNWGWFGDDWGWCCQIWVIVIGDDLGSSWSYKDHDLWNEIGETQIEGQLTRTATPQCML